MRIINFADSGLSRGDRVKFGIRSGTVVGVKWPPVGVLPMGFEIHFDDTPWKEKGKHREYVDLMRRVGEPELEAY